MRNFKVPLGALRVLMLLSILTGSTAWARDLEGRLGLGYNAEFAAYRDAGVPAISLKYNFTHDIGVEGIAGATTASPTTSVIGAKFFKGLFYETNLNFYFMLGAALEDVTGTTGAEFLGGFGAEFFIPGIESLGFSMETGGSMDNVTTGSFALRTLGVSFLNAGIHFYF